jgi:phytoene desaturase
LRLLEFPILFLGATPQNTPALYSIMNHAGLTQGTWYPMGGMRRIPEALESLSLELGVKIATSQAVTKIQVENGKTTGVFTEDGFFPADAVVAACDYAHTEQNLLEPEYRNYSSKYWDTRVLAPSALIFYVGLNTRVKDVEHHTLFFDEDFGVHAEEIYTDPKWPQKPLFYLCCPSVTDPTVAPEGKENLFVLIPVASGLEDSEAMREEYFNKVITRMESYYGQDIRNHIEYTRSYCVNDFKEDYNALRGNAYGLANTLTQTAVLKPRIRNKKISNLFYSGQLTVPGPGVPPSLISAQIAAKLIQNYFKK